MLPLDASVLSWDKLKDAASHDKQLNELADVIENEVANKDEWPASIADFYSARTHFTVQRPVIFYKSRVVVPSVLQNAVLEILHSGHGGVSSMMLRASDSVWWPGIQADIEKTRNSCHSCNVSSPSQPAAPPTQLPSPSYPFEQICADYFSYMGNKYLVIVDRFSNWISVHTVKTGAGADTLVKMLRTFFLTYGVSSELASDGGLEFVSSTTQEFLKEWGVHLRLSSAYHPHSNQRAELGVKTAKRFIRDNVDKSGSLDNDKFGRALLYYRNTPCCDLKLSPA